MIIFAFIFKLCIWTFVSYGITQIIVDSYIFEGMRNRLMRTRPMFGALVNCMLCTGVWVSLFTSVMMWSPTETMFITDIVNLEYVTAMEHMSIGQIDDVSNVVSLILYQAYSLWIFILLRFFDAMLGGTLIWFMYAIERRLLFFGE